MTALVRYAQACRALAAAKATDEVLAIRDKAEALRVYARQARNKQLEIDASEIRFRAERRIGEIMCAQRDAGQMAPAGRPRRIGSVTHPIAHPITHPITTWPSLAAAGIGKQLADRARRYAAVSPDAFETMLAARRAVIARENGRITVELEAAGDKALRRAEREAALGARQAAWPKQRYGVILGDPEWRNEPWSRETGLNRAADNHYPTSTLATICTRDVASIAAPDSLLALWAIVPMLAEAFCVLDAWGFARIERDPETGFLGLDKGAARYVSSGAWVKYRPGANGKGPMGMGHWFRVDHEILLLATRGQVPAPAKGTQARSVFDVPASRVHSQKPELVAEMLEGFYPNLPKIELNRRGPARPGWDAWGNEVEPASGAQVAA